MEYIIDESYDFPVLPGSADADNFLLQIASSDGSDFVELPKLPFQKRKNYTLPQKLLCRVKGFDNYGRPVLAHMIAPYVNELYARTFERGETFECEVTGVPDKPGEDPYIVRDNNGIFFRMADSERMLSKGQKIRCKFTRMTPRFFQLKRVDEGSKLPFYAPSAIFDAIGLKSHAREFVSGMIDRWPEMSVVREEITAQNPLWPMTLHHTVMRLLPDWLSKARLVRNRKALRRLIEVLRDGVLYLLEGSGFLNAVPNENRRALRQQLTEMAESVEPYRQTFELITHKRHNAFIESLLDKLQKSGYLYHPAEQFAVLMIIFRLYPETVGNYLNRIFESIFGRDLDNWRREPFRSAFVEQFEIYVRQSRDEIEALPLAESREQKSRLEAIITAIALRLILSDRQDDNLDLINRSESLFYKYISILRPLNTEALLTKSFLALLGADVSSRLSYEQLKEPMMMMTHATVLPAGDIMTRITSTHRYTGNDVDVSISSGGIRLSLSKRRDMTEEVIPSGLMPWLSPQIVLNGIPKLSGSRLNKISEHNQWWHNIETGLFDYVKPVETAEVQTPIPVRKAEKQDEVYIVIDSVEDAYTNNPTFICHIEDDEFEYGTGILKRDQIIGYNLRQPYERAYKNADRTQLGFLARIIDVRPDGSYIFSLRERVDDFIAEAFNFKETFTAIIAGVNERDYSAISYNGIGLFVIRDNEAGANLSVGDVVRCRLEQTGKQGQVRAFALEVSDDPADRIEKGEAFVTLMRGIGEGVSDNEDSEDIDLREEELMRDIDEILTPGDLREIIGIIRFKAIAETDLIKAYDYLRFARILALVLGDNRLAEQLGTHAALLSQHQYYATNSRIDAEELESLQPAALPDPLLRLIYHRLEMVSWLDKPEKMGDLYRTVNEPANELEGSIARLVLSYNMLHTSDSETNDYIGEIKREIMHKLNVNNETRRGKYYGSESKYLEFKTSIIYPAVAPGEEMREDPEAQQFHIMSRVAGLLNANGGRLYLGVNNDGYEVGLCDDFKYFERKPVKVGNFVSKIRNIDNLCVFLENLVNNVFGPSIARKIEISADDEAEKGVVLISVAESLDPVFINGRLFVRQSGQSTREYHGSDIDDFVKERKELKAERAHLLITEEQISEPEKEDSTNVQPVATPQVAPSEEDLKPEAVEENTEATNILATSHWLPNVCHSYEVGFADPYGYLYFMDDNTLIFSTVDLYKEPGTDCRLALVIPHERADEFLVLGFDNERALKVNLQEIYSKGENMELDINGEYKLMFAAIVGKDDMLVCIGTDSGGNLWKRANKVSAIESGHLTSTPRRLHDAPIHHTFGYEVAAPSAAERLADCLADKLPSKRFGATLRVKEGSSALQFKIDELTKDCQNG